MCIGVLRNDSVLVVCTCAAVFQNLNFAPEWRQIMVFKHSYKVYYNNSCTDKKTVNGLCQLIKKSCYFINQHSPEIHCFNLKFTCKFTLHNHATLRISHTSSSNTVWTDWMQPKFCEKHVEKHHFFRKVQITIKIEIGIPTSDTVS